MNKGVFGHNDSDDDCSRLRKIKLPESIAKGQRDTEFGLFDGNTCTHLKLGPSNQNNSDVHDMHM